MTRAEFDKIFNEKYNECFDPKEFSSAFAKFAADFKNQKPKMSQDEILTSLFSMVVSFQTSKNKAFIYSLLTALLPLSE